VTFINRGLNKDQGETMPGQHPSSPPHTGPRPLYAVSIQNCIAQGDLAKMKTLVVEAEKHLADHGDVSAALEVLKTEVAKLENKP
jgi:Domain of unknown function (DUF1843)